MVEITCPPEDRPLEGNNHFFYAGGDVASQSVRDPSTVTNSDSKNDSNESE